VAVDTVPPVSVAAGRIAAAAACLLAVLAARGLRLPRSARAWLHFASLAVLGNALPFCLIGWGLERVPSGATGILTGIMPMVTLVLAHFFVPGEPMTRRRTLGFVLGFAGVVTLTGPEALRELGGEPSDLVRQLAVVGGAVCYSLNAIVARHLPPTNALVSAATTLLLATFLIAPVALAVDRPWELAPSASSLWAMAWLGVGATAAATIVYYRLIASAGPTFFSTANFLIPIVALAAGVVFRDEEASWSALLALALVLSGLALAGGVAPRTVPGQGSPGT
jgi:drug/metabolite transporter (DMT)-like permease